MNDIQNSAACIAFAGFVKERRKALGKTARAVAANVDMLPSNYCKLEHGAFQPPSDEKLRLLANALELTDDADPTTYTFYNLAAKALNSVPLDVADILSRYEAMPMMLRTLNCKRLTQQELDRIVEMIRGKA